MNKQALYQILRIVDTDKIQPDDIIDAELFKCLQSSSMRNNCFLSDNDSFKYHINRFCTACNTELSCGHLERRELDELFTQLDYVCSACKDKAAKKYIDDKLTVMDYFCRCEPKRSYSELKGDARKLSEFWYALSADLKDIFAAKLRQLDYRSQYLNCIYWKCVCEIKFQEAGMKCELRNCAYCKNRLSSKKSEFEFHHPKHYYEELIGRELDNLDQILMLCSNGHRMQHQEFFIKDEIKI